MNPTAFVLRHDRLAWTVVFSIVLLGSLAFVDFPSREDPAIRIPQAMVFTSFPGMPPEQVENLITRPLEERFRQIGEIKHITSYSQAGLSIIQVHVHEHTPDFTVVWEKLRRKARDAEPYLPQGVHGPYVNDDYADVSIVTLALSGKDWSMSELRDAARQMRDRLYTVPGIRRVTLFGVPEEKAYLEADSSVLDKASFRVGEIVRSIQDQNRILPAGEILTEHRIIPVETSGKLEDVDDLRNVLVPSSDGLNLLPLEDYVNVRSTYSEPPTELVYHNGKRAIMVSASLQEGGNVQSMGPLLRNFIADARTELPLGMQLEVAGMQPEVVEKSIGMVTSSLLQTLGIVLLVVVLALGIREGLVVGASIPVTILAALILMYLLGVELQFVSLASIIISLGMLVDNGIVITEDSHLRMGQGELGPMAVIASSKDLALPLLTSTLTTVMAFMPILTVNSTSGEFMRSLAVVVGVMLCCSWATSVTFVPLLASRVLREGKQEKLFFLVPLYTRLLDAALKRPVLALAMVLLLVIGFQGLLRSVNFEMYPSSSRPEVLVYVDLPSGYNIYQTRDAVNSLQQWLLHEDNGELVDSVSSYIGTGGPRFSLAIVPNRPAAHRGYLMVTAGDSEKAKRLLADIRQFAADEISLATVRTELVYRGIVPPGVVELRFSGTDPDVLYDMAVEAERALAGIPDTLHVRNDWENRSRRLRVSIDQDRAYQAGVQYQGIAGALNAEFTGKRVSEIRQGDLTVPILLRSPAQRGSAAGGLNLESLKLPIGDGSSGDYVTLDQVAKVEEVTQFANILRRDLVYTVTVSGKHLHWDSSALQKRWDKEIENIYRDLPPGYQIKIGGELENIDQNAGAMTVTVPLFLALMLSLVVAQFNSMRRTVIVFLTIPMAVAGGIVGLYVTQIPLDFIGTLGFLSLAGIVINHAIVLISQIDTLSRQGDSLLVAIRAAATTRLRPICITSVTTVLGLVPLLLMEEKLFRSMAVVIMSGLTVGTLMTIFAVPLLYLLLMRLRPG